MWALLLQLEKVIWESSLLALCPFRQIWPCKPSYQLQSMIHLAPSGPGEALQAHALLIKRFVGEFIFKACATWKLMITSQAAEQHRRVTTGNLWAIHSNLQFIQQSSQCFSHIQHNVMHVVEWVEFEGIWVDFSQNDINVITVHSSRKSSAGSSRLASGRERSTYGQERLTESARERMADWTNSAEVFVRLWIRSGL